MKQKHQLPAGYHDAESAAQLLGMSKLALLKLMRELGWLNTGGGDGNHNMPRRELIKCGYLSTQDRGYCLKGKKEIAKSYRVMLLSQAGFTALKHELEKSKMAQPLPAPVKPETAQAQRPAPTPTEETVVPFNRETADAEREKALEQLRAWGIAS